MYVDLKAKVPVAGCCLWPLITQFAGQVNMPVTTKLSPEWNLADVVSTPFLPRAEQLNATGGDDCLLCRATQ